MRNEYGKTEYQLLGAPDELGVQRGLAEFRAGRPVLIAAGDERLVALPVDGATASSVAALKALGAPALPRLAVTARRARVLGLETSTPLVLDLHPTDELETIWSLAASVGGESRPVAGPAGPAAIAAIELAKLAQRLPALLVTAGETIAEHIERAMITVDAAAAMRFRRSIVDSLTVVSEAQIPLQEGVPAHFHIFRDASGGNPVAIIVGKLDFSHPVPVRLHSACLTGDVFGSRRCDCGAQLKLALDRLIAAGGGVILYLEQEGRGLGLANKMRAYALQDTGLDTVDANTTLGFDDDERDYSVAARMLQMLGCHRVLLLTNNPGKLEALAAAGVEVSGRMPLYTPINADNRRYLTAKAARAGHWLDGVPVHPSDDENERVRSSPGP